MKRIYNLILPLSIATVTSHAASTKIVKHTIKNGETLYTIAHANHTTIDEVRKANDLKKGDMLKLGKILTVPIDTYFPNKVSTKKVLAKITTVKHTILSGETLYTIAHANHTTIDEVRKANNLKKGDMLNLGRILTVPTNTYFPMPKEKNVTLVKAEGKKFRKQKLAIKKEKVVKAVAKSDLKEIESKIVVIKKTNSKKVVQHIIKRGDSLYVIAQNNHTTVTKLRELNHIKKGEVLKLGRVLDLASSGIAKKEDSKVFLAKVKKTNVIKIEKKKLENKKVKTKKVVIAKKTTVKKNVKLTQHTIKKGDSLYTIAKSNKTTISILSEINKLKKGEILKLGRVLHVPCSSKVVVAKKKKESKVVLAKKSIKKSKVASLKKKRQDKKLAKALKYAESTKLAKVRVKKSKKFSFSDIFFRGSSKSKKCSVKSSNITRLAKSKLGRRYVWGAVGKKNTFDCSGLTTYVCKKNGIKIPRRAIEQSKHGKYISRKNLRPGDLIFFDTSKRRRGYVNHVGIYIGNNKFIHASSAKHKVVITSLKTPFYSQRYKGARRVSS